MQIRLKHAVGAISLLTLALPLWAHTDTNTLTLSENAVIGSEQLKPGVYQLKADESRNDITVVREGKVIAEVPGHWVQLPKKATDSQVDMDSNTVMQVQFSGRTEEFEVQQGSANGNSTASPQR